MINYNVMFLTFLDLAQNPNFFEVFFFFFFLIETQFNTKAI